MVCDLAERSAGPCRGLPNRLHSDQYRLPNAGRQSQYSPDYRDLPGAREGGEAFRPAPGDRQGSGEQDDNIRGDEEEGGRHYQGHQEGRLASHLHSRRQVAAGEGLRAVRVQKRQDDDPRSYRRGCSRFRRGGC